MTDQLRIIFSLALIGFASCGRLEPQYLPPRGGSFSVAGRGSYSTASSSAYSAAGSSAYASNGAYNTPIVRYDNVNNGDGVYRFNYETANGISAHESGSPRVAGREGAAVAAEGGFSYRAPDGQQISLTYTADENGFHPVGAHLPTPPPIPEEILRSIEFNKRNPSSEGAYNPGNGESAGRSTGYHY